MTELTTPVNTNQKVIAHWIVSPVSDGLAHAIAGVQAVLKERFSEAVWAVPPMMTVHTYNDL